VLACNNDGVWNESGATLALIILPHFWQTWWFRGLAVLMVILAFVGAYELRLASERGLTRLRLRIARDLHDEVGSNIGSIALLSEVISRRADSTPEEVSEIRRIAVQTVDALRDIVWFLDPASDNIGDVTMRMKETAATMLPGIPFQFDSQAENPSARLPLEVRRNIFPVFKEILHNITRHARATRVQILLRSAADRLELTVTDNGVGFVVDQAHSGNGLKNLRRRAG